jgi:hypothetical protein
LCIKNKDNAKEQNIHRQQKNTNHMSLFLLTVVNLSEESLGLTDASGRAVEAWVCGRLLTGIAGSKLAEAWMSVSLECFVVR